jgi:hypothetical protein
VSEGEEGGEEGEVMNRRRRRRKGEERNAEERGYNDQTRVNPAYPSE